MLARWEFEKYCWSVFAAVTLPDSKECCRLMTNLRDAHIKDALEDRRERERELAVRHVG